LKKPIISDCKADGLLKIKQAGWGEIEGTKDMREFCIIDAYYERVRLNCGF